jgi:hypothetical protein
MAAAGVPVKPVAAQPATAPTSDLLAALCAGVTDAKQNEETWAEYLEEWHRKQKVLSAKEDDITEQIAAYVPEERQYELVSKLSDIAGDMAHHEMNRTLELVVRHMPGLESMLRLVFAHAVDTWYDQETECGNGWCRERGW